MGAGVAGEGKPVEAVAKEDPTTKTKAKVPLTCLILE
jgi:hypothetical protein